MRASNAASQDGFSLLEAIMAIGLTAVILSIFAATTSTSVFLRKAGYAVQASNFVREELDALRSIPFSELTTRTNGNFLGLTIARGAWKTKAVVSPPSGTQVLALDTAVSAKVTETGLAVVPGNYRDDFDFTASLLAQGASPSGWGTGIAFRYRDAENHYRFRFSSGGIALDEVYHGTTTTLWSQSATYNKDTWYTLRIVATGTSFQLYRNGALLTTQVDTTFTSGDIALLSLSSALVYADSLSITEYAATTAWNFDAETAGTTPVDWQRFAYEDLPSGAGTLTISDYLSQTTIKQATVTVTWIDTGFNKTMTGTTLIIQ